MEKTNRKNTNEKSQISDIPLLSNFFSKWFYISIVFILIGLVLSSLNNPNNPNQTASYLISLLSSFFKDIGMAVFVGNIFSFILGTNEFFGYIRDRLIKIIISKDFVTTLATEERRDLLKTVLRPSNELSSIYSRISDYFESYVDNSLKLFHSPYRSGLSINALIRFDENKKKIIAEEDISYRIYRVDNKFEDLIIGFEDTSSEHIETRVVTPTGEEKTFSQEDLKENSMNKDDSIRKSFSLTLPDEYDIHHHLSIHRKLIEYGEDHWQLFSYKTIQPCDGLDISIRCQGDVKVRTYITYGSEPKFKTTMEPSKIRITCDDWLRPGFGVCVVLSRDCDATCYKYDKLIPPSDN